MFRKSKSALGTIAAGFILAAGPASEGRAALFYDISLGAGAVINDNLHLDPRTPVEAGAESTEGAAGAEATSGLRQPVEQTIFTIKPGVVVAWSEHRDRLLLNYSGEYSMYQGDEERDSSWVHSIAADLNWRRWSPFFLEAREERTRVPRTQEREGEAFVDQVDRNRLSGRTGLVWEIGPRSAVELVYRGELETYSVIGAADPVDGETDSGIDEFDRVQRHSGEALVRHRWTPLWWGEARLSYGLVDRDLASDSAELRVAVAVDQRWSEHLAFRYRLEWRRDDDDEPAGVDAATEGASIENAATEIPSNKVRNNLLVAGEMSGDLGRRGSWNLGYQDNQEDQSDGDTLKTGRASGAVALRARLGSTLNVGGWYETRDFRVSGREEVAWGPTLGVRWLIAPWAALDLVGNWTSTTIRQEGLPEVEDRTTRAAAGLVFLLFNRIQLEAGYGYRKNDSTDALRSYANNLVFALLTFHFRPVGAGQLSSSYVSVLVAGGAPSGGIVQTSDDGAAGSVP